MVHVWVRAEERANEKRAPLTPSGARELLEAGFEITVESNKARVIPDDGYANVGCRIADAGSWRNAPADAVVLGLKELPADGTALPHTHIMFGHAFKGQHGADAFLSRFAEGGGVLLDLEYLVDENGRRKAAFGYWAGFAGAAVSLLAWAAQRNANICPPVGVFASADEMVAEVRKALNGAAPRAIVIGALGRVGTGARDLCRRAQVATTDWDIAETSRGAPFPEILDHDLFLNCILANPGCPVFVPTSALNAKRRLSVVGDIACDPGSDYNPIPVYDTVTSWTKPVVRVHEDPLLDVMAIDNLPSLLPAESSDDFADQLLPMLKQLGDPSNAVWARANQTFQTHIDRIQKDAK